MSFSIQCSSMERKLLQRRMEGLLPVELDLWIKGLRGYRMAPLKPLSLPNLRLVHEAPPAELDDPDRLEVLLANLGLSADRPDLFPDYLQGMLGKGLCHWQYPRQFAPYLCAVGRLRPTTYLEIGVQHGGTFMITVEYLQRHTKAPVRGYAIDLQDPPALREYAKVRRNTHFTRMNSSSPRFGPWLRSHGPFDLVLIDGDHSYAGCMADFQAVKPHANAIAFHDISNTAEWDVHRVWAQVKAEHAGAWRFEEFTAQYAGIPERVGHDLLGIGLMIRD